MRCRRSRSADIRWDAWLPRALRSEGSLTVSSSSTRAESGLSYGGTVPLAHPFDLSGKVTLITGANSGLGLGFAEGIARAGGDVVIWGRREDRNAAAAERLRAHGVRVETDDGRTCADEAAQQLGFARALDNDGPARRRDRERGLRHASRRSST